MILRPIAFFFKSVKQNTIERAINTIIQKKDLLDFVTNDNFSIITSKHYMTFPLMNYVDVVDLSNRINITGELNSILSSLTTALVERYQTAPHLKVEEKDWLNSLKDICYRNTGALPEPYKSQRKDLLDYYFTALR